MIKMPHHGAARIGRWGNHSLLYPCLPLPALIAPDKAFAENLEDWHEIGATVGYWLVGLHAAAALYHHYVRRDDTLRRMLPG
jgi:cytochrome b561